MKVLLIEPCYENFGGYFRAIGIAKGLARKGLKVDLVISSRKKVFLGISKKVIEKNLVQYELPRIEVNHFISGRMLRSIIATCFVIFRRYDVIHCFAIVQFESGLPFIVSKLLRKKVVIDWDDYWTDAHKLVAIYNFFPIKTYLKLCEYWLQGFAKYATTTSYFLTNELKKIGVKNVLTLINGINLDQFEPISKARARRVLSLNNEDKILLSFGHTYFKERTLFLLKIFEEIYKLDPTIKLYLNQDIKELIRVEVPDFDIKSKFFENIINVGYLDKEKLPVYVGAADLMLFPMGNTSSEKACFPTRIGTYLNGERPIVTNITSTQAYLTLKKFGLAISGYDEVDIAKKVIDYFNDENFSSAMKLRLAKAKKELSWSFMSTKIISFYKYVVRH